MYRKRVAAMEANQSKAAWKSETFNKENRIVLYFILALNQIHVTCLNNWVSSNNNQLKEQIFNICMACDINL